MTHESLPNGEHPDGPEHDHTLPDAESIVWSSNPEDTDLPPLGGDL